MIHCTLCDHFWLSLDLRKKGTTYCCPCCGAALLLELPEEYTPDELS